MRPCGIQRKIVEILLKDFTGKRSFAILQVNDRLFFGGMGGMQMQDTKEKILHTALLLFARDGYEAV